jgi:hypothetical protein
MKRDGFEPQQLQAADHPVAGCSQDGSHGKKGTFLITRYVFNIFFAPRLDV